MIDLVSAAIGFQSFCEQRGWPFCFIGGLAVQRWGEPRITRDVDASLYTSFTNDAGFVDAILKEFEGRLPEARSFALANRVLLVFGAGNVPLDIGLAGFPFELQIIERATPFAFGGASPVRICSAEDLMVLKAFANRARDWEDVKGVITRQRDALDWRLIESSLEPLAVATERPELLDVLRALRREVGGD